MHGIVFAELQKFVTRKLAHAGWRQVAEKAGFAQQVYLPAGQYPDSELFALVAATSGITGQEPLQVVEEFGQFLAPSLMGTFWTRNGNPLT